MYGYRDLWHLSSNVQKCADPMLHDNYRHPLTKKETQTTPVFLFSLKRATMRALDPHMYCFVLDGNKDSPVRSEEKGEGKRKQYHISITPIEVNKKWRFKIPFDIYSGRTAAGFAFQ